MIFNNLDNLTFAKNIVLENKDSKIAYAIKDSYGQVIASNSTFLNYTGIPNLKDLKGLGDKDIRLWKDNIYDYAIGEKISISSQAYYLSTEYLPMQNSTDVANILTEKVPFTDTDGKNYIFVRFKVLDKDSLTNCLAYTIDDISMVEFKYYFEPLKFTSREYRVLKYLIEHNLEYNQIAQIMCLTQSGIKSSIQSIYNNLDIWKKEYRKINFLRSLLKYMFLPDSNKEISKHIRF